MRYDENRKEAITKTEKKGYNKDRAENRKKGITETEKKGDNKDRDENRKKGNNGDREKGNDEEKKAMSKIIYPTLPFIYLSWFIFRQSP